MWEKALEICKELNLQYEEETFEYKKIGGNTQENGNIVWGKSR